MNETVGEKPRPYSKMSAYNISIEGSMVGAEQLPGGWDVFAVFEIPEEGDKFRTNTEAVKSSDPRWQVRLDTIQSNLSKH